MEYNLNCNTRVLEIVITVNTFILLCIFFAHLFSLSALNTLYCHVHVRMQSFTQFIFFTLFFITIIIGKEIDRQAGIVLNSNYIYN